jgi:hypothetical protein
MKGVSKSSYGKLDITYQSFKSFERFNSTLFDWSLQKYADLDLREREESFCVGTPTASLLKGFDR